MADFKISRIRYTWRGNWATSRSYNQDDIIRFGAKAWVCIRQHTSTDFESDYTYTAPGETQQSPAWVLMCDGFTWRSEWQSSTLYSPGDVISYGGITYLCTDSHTSSDFESESANWTSYIETIGWKGNWATSTSYGIDDIVKYNGIVYRCITTHTSAGDTAAGLEVDQAKWEIYHDGIQYRGIWLAEIRYRKNDLVKYGGTIFRCTTGHTSSSDALDDAYFSIELYGSEYDSEWSSSTYYNTGDIVKHGGNIYYAIANNVNQNPGEYDTYDGSDSWTAIAKGTNLRGDWDVDESYKSGDVVRRGGVLYIALQNVDGDGSTLGYLNPENWETVISADNWKDYWRAGQDYGVGDIVLFDGSAYLCNYAHESTSQNYPGDNGEGFEYWDLMLLAAEGTGLSSKGDLLTYGLSRKLAGDESTFDVTNIPIGNSEDLLQVGNSNEPVYSSWGNETRVFYVSPQGIDDASENDRGVNYNKPFKTIRYACEQANDGYTFGTTIKVTTGIYEEVLPIIIPDTTVIMGDEVRATIIKPKPANPALNGDYTYTIAALNRLSGIIPAVIKNNAVTPTIGNTATQYPVTDQILIEDEFGQPILDDDGNLQYETAIVQGSDDAAGHVQTLVENISDYITYYIAGSGSLLDMDGSNDITADNGYLYAAQYLEANKDFLAEEGAAFIAFTYPNYEFDSASCKRDVRAFVDAFIYDLRYIGNYRSVLAARYYKNAVLGSETEDMFYCRNATGVRNCTLDGLTGTLTPPNVFDLYRRPTGGSYCSLDPGWGPDDEKAWITTRSPYLQNCCCFGTCATGQKIDGALHNGGLKSMVSNDFTQIISDGIGAHVLNNGRAELVSVFTYYSQVGYLAERGGIIRATNGNNSYGKFGSLASGVDETEVPGSGKVNNRTSHAIVNDAFAGEVNDEILVLEYLNCGQNYSQATASFVGSGVNAEVEFDEFRDQAIFDVRLIDPPDSGRAGGGGFTNAGNNCQAGNLTSITLATNDDAEESEYLGLRIIITSGTGTGQYGIVSAYNTLTKVLDVIRESDGQAGWDHVTPGWPLAPILDTSSTYRLEPRPIFEEPAFVAEQIDFGAGTTYANVVYGETTATFNNVVSELGTGSVITDDGLVPTAATFNVTKLGRDYSISIVNTGAGYAVNDVLTIVGTDLGGTSPDNDITVYVTDVSDDSTNSILGYTYEGNATSGRFVASATVGQTAAHSLDGETWSIGAFPSAGNWKCLAAGDNGFVAIRYDSNRAATSTNGVTWTQRTMPGSHLWNDVAYGEGIFLAVAGDGDSAAYSLNKGVTWIATTIPDIGDSSSNEWTSVAYGKGKFVVIANSNNVAAVAEWNGSSFTWSTTIMDVIDDSSQRDWVEVSYGNNRFVAVSSQGDIGYSFDGIVWYPGTMPTPDGSTIMNWNSINYGQGVFVATCDTGGRDIAGDATTGPTTFIATSTDGIVWTSRFLSAEAEWRRAAFGNPDLHVGDSTVSSNTGMWVIVPGNTGQYGQRVFTGARAQGRCVVQTGRITQIKIWDPGSGYTTEPTLLIADPNNTSEIFVENRLGYGVLAQPTWINRGVGYKTSTTTVTINGDGFADIIPADDRITLKGLDRYPGPGAQLLFTGNDQIYTVVTITELGQDLDGTFSAYFRIDPPLEIIDKLEHDTDVLVRERYSQIRITGHDFLDVGTGNFLETNYPEVYNAGLLYLTAPEDEIVESGGGRCFYTSTDQNGNFRCGELFAVEQATGIVTISADFFQLDGLTELALGGVRLGGSGAVVREFSTDPLFTEDSNNIVPTQRAIKAYLQGRLSVGGSELTTASFIAGTIKVGPNEIRSTISGLIRVVGHADFSGAVADPAKEGEVDRSGEVSGMMLAQNMFHKSFSDDPNRLS